MNTLAVKLWQEIEQHKQKILAIQPQWDGTLPEDLRLEPYATALWKYYNRLCVVQQMRECLDFANERFTDDG